MDKHNITASFVMPQPTLESIPDVHQKIAEMARKYPERIYGMASLDPWMSEEEYLSQVHTCIVDYAFIAIKLHPLGHNIPPLSPLCNKIYEAARQYKVPVIVHTGIGNPFSLPS